MGNNPFSRSSPIILQSNRLKYSCLGKERKLLLSVNIPINLDNNPILETCIYKVEYMDGHKALLAAKTISENIFAQIDNEGCCFVLLDSIIDHCGDGTQLLEEVHGKSVFFQYFQRRAMKHEKM